jgi:site-specific DNA-methyltransferase (adenine-specific)
LGGTDYDLNWALMNARKSGGLSNLPKAKRFQVETPDEFEYASELAVRYLQREHNISLDQVLCDPLRAEEFDNRANMLAPGFAPLDYRWCALGLRKAGRLKGMAEKVGKRLPRLEELGAVERIAVDSIPDCSGLYLFSSQDSPVFISQTDNLRHRIERHMKVSPSRGLPTWLWDEGAARLSLSLAPMPKMNRSVRQAAELLLVRKLHPALNYERQAA